MLMRPADAAPDRDDAAAPPAPAAARAAALLTALACFLLGRPYFGIRHDARIYVGRAEADLGRNGMAHDLMFAHDGQSKFSVFGALFRPLVEHLGSAPAAMLATAVGLAVWLTAAAVLLSRFCRGAALWAGIVALGVFPGFYAGVLAYAEPFVTPRLFAEALVCLSLALVVDRRWIAAGALLVAAAALHPIMTLPGLAVFGVMLVLQDRRWLALAAAGLAAALGTAFAGLPLISRLVTPVDPAWLAMLQHRSAYLFPAIWNDGSWLMLARQMATLILAATLIGGRPRQLAIAALVVGAGGVLASVLAPTLLMVQMQPWRGQWLVAVLSTALLPFALARLWQDGSGGKAAAALLAVAWGAPDPAWLGGACAALALAYRLVPQARNLSPMAARIAWIGAGLALARTAFVAVAAGAINGLAVGFDNLITRMLLSQGLAIAATLLAVAVVVRGEAAGRLATRPASAALAALALVGAALVWDAQDDWTRARDRSADAAALRAQLPAGEIFWLGGDGRSGPWTGRPEWWSVNEGASSVFDRTLAMEWARRHDLLVRAGLATRRIEMFESANTPRPKLSAASLALVCAAPSGPVAVIARLDQTAADVRGLATGRWSTAASPRSGPFLIFRCDRTADHPAAAGFRLNAPAAMPPSAIATP